MNMEQSGWETNIVTITFGKDVYAFKPSGTTTIEDIVIQIENIREVVRSVIKAVEEMEDAEEKLSITDFMQCVLDTIKENLVNDAGDPMTLDPVGIGFSLVTINGEA